MKKFSQSLPMVAALVLIIGFGASTNSGMPENLKILVDAKHGLM